MKKILILTMFVVCLIPTIAMAKEDVGVTLPTSVVHSLGWLAGAVATGLAAWAGVAAVKNKVNNPIPNIVNTIGGGGAPAKAGVTKSDRVQEIVAKILQLSAVGGDDDLVSLVLTVNRANKEPISFSVNLGEPTKSPTNSQSTR